MIDRNESSRSHPLEQIYLQGLMSIGGLPALSLAHMVENVSFSVAGDLWCVDRSSGSENGERPRDEYAARMVNCLL